MHNRRWKSGVVLRIAIAKPNKRLSTFSYLVSLGDAREKRGKSETNRKPHENSFPSTSENPQLPIDESFRRRINIDSVNHIAIIRASFTSNINTRKSLTHGVSHRFRSKERRNNKISCVLSFTRIFVLMNYDGTFSKHFNSVECVRSERTVDRPP